MDEDAESQSSLALLQDAQPLEVVLESEERLGSSSDDLNDDLSDPLVSEASPDHISINHLENLTYASERRPEHPEDVTTPVKPAPPTRPNKYHGPPATWRDWTAAERQIVASLDQLRAQDLSIHLYNFYCLKRRVDSTKEWQPDTDPDTDDQFSNSRKRKAWLPVKTWTAWPMDAELVPREADDFKGGAYADELIFPRKAVPPSDLLSDLLVARVCMKAKEKLREREWEDSDVEKVDLPREKEWRSQRRVEELAGNTESHRQYEPVVMADDERAKSILQPSINHVLHKLDALLMGLHHARSSYALYGKPSADSRPVTDEEGPTSRKRKRKAAPRSIRKGSSPRGSAEESGAGTQSAASGFKIKAGLGLRDWSDVLGVASMCGFPSEVVAKAAARCSNLFDEGILFRTLSEGKDDYREVKYLPDLISVGDLQAFEQSQSKNSHSPDAGDDDRVGGVHVDGFMQPIQQHKSWSRPSRRKKQGQ
ncbi:MAG: hypothetical protein L6R40_007663 [Gallowayella cf. fulva]|nr:MAG: hypothetical protein L6R40_007663 [Xanthomendoza cf. fulva]